MATIDGNTLHHSTVANTLIKCHSILLPSTSTNNAQDMTEDPQTVPHTTYIKLLRDKNKRKHKIGAERKQMEKHRNNSKIRLIPAVNRLRNYSVNY